MRVLLLGRSGQVGTGLRALMPPEAETVAPAREEADFETPGRLAGIVESLKPDLIVNAAAYTAVDKAETDRAQARRVNTEAVEELAEAAKAADAWLIHYSTDYVFDGGKAGPYLETDPTHPLNVYGETKRDGELAIARTGCRHLIFRTSWVYAPGAANFLTKILALAAEREHLSVVDDQIGAPTSARLIAETTLTALARIAGGTAPASGLYHLTAAGETSWHGYARFAVAQAMARGMAVKATPERIVAVGSGAYPTPARRPRNSRLATGKLEAALGLTLPDWRDEVALALDAIVMEPAS